MTSLTVPGAQPLSDAEIEAVVDLRLHLSTRNGRLSRTVRAGNRGQHVTFDDVAKTPATAPPIPTTVQWKGQTVRYLERDAIANDAEVSAVALPADGSGLTATVLLSGKIGGNDGALVTRKENFLFLNGSRLDADVAYLITDLLDLPAGRTAPGDYWSTVGPSLSAFIGYADHQRIQCRLPVASGVLLRIDRRDSRGVVAQTTVTYDSAAGFQHDVAAGEIIVVSTVTPRVLSNLLLTETRLQFTITGVPGKSCQVEANANLQQWTPVDEVVNVTGSITVSYPQPVPLAASSTAFAS